MDPITHRIASGSGAQTRLGPVGQCIYCRRAPPEVTLSGEHIIADGLGGDLILPEASCEHCARVTCRSEGLFLREMVRDARGTVGLKARKKRAKQEQEFLKEIAGEEQKLSIPYTPDNPAIFVSFVTGSPPGILLGGDADFTCDLRATFAMPANFLDRAREKFGLGKFRLLSRYHPGIAGQVLAKTAHAFTVAQLGIDGFEPLLCDFIRARDPAFPAYLIGAEERPATADGTIHEVTLREDKYPKPFPKLGVYIPQPILLVKMRLFAMMGGPSFTVAVGFPR